MFKHTNVALTKVPMLIPVTDLFGTCGGIKEQQNQFLLTYRP
jgi:hypothetical protein